MSAMVCRYDKKRPKGCVALRRRHQKMGSLGKSCDRLGSGGGGGLPEPLPDPPPPFL